MAKIKPFQMVHYDYRFTAELDKLITPPYDVISAEEQEKFYQSNPFNIIRLVLGKQYENDANGDNRYTRAAATLNQWLSEGILTKDASPSLTVYRMDFEQPDGGVASIDGLIALVKVDAYGKGKVLPHEKTYKGPKLDQLNLLRACKANFTPIHALFNDESNAIMGRYEQWIQGPPQQETKDANGTVHKTWTVQDAKTIADICDLLLPKSLFIADGHHRYETALAYRNEIRATGVTDPDGPHEYVMMYLTSMAHPGLTILPAHRMVKGLRGLDLSTVEKVLEPYFHIEELAFSQDDRKEVARVLVERIRSYSNVGGKFGMVVQGEKCFRLLRLKDPRAVDSLMDDDIPSSLRGLDVTILREIIMNHGLGLDKDNSEGNIEYTPLVSEAMDKALKGEVQISFILNPTRVDQMRTAAELGHKLPHKSTYFFPKLSSGLVLNVF
ncbi:MAG TPA: DUF1015 domain-containing protein [Desulfomonilaceae bacterium]|nr:DUF1015 domain-containing protein [Desulfomonilaceae bacterium]